MRTNRRGTRSSWLSVGLVVVVAVVLVRLIWGCWTLWQSEPPYVSGPLDLERRFEAAAFLEFASLVPSERGLTGSLVPLALLEAALDDLLHSPGLVGQLALLVLMLSAAGVARELFPDARGSALMTVVLLATLPTLGRFAWTSQAAPLVAAFTAATIYTYLLWQRTHRPAAAIACGLTALAANSCSIDAWLLLLPLWLWGLYHVLRGRGGPRWAGLLALGLAIIPVGIYTAGAGGLPIGAVGFWKDHLGFGATAAPAGAFSSALTELALHAPILVLGLPMILLARVILREAPVPVGRPLGIGVLVVIVSVFQRSNAEQALERLLVCVVLAAPFIAGCTVAAIVRACDRKVAPLFLVWLLVLTQAGFSLPHLAIPVDTEERPILQLGSMIRDLYDEGVLETADLVGIQNRANQEDLRPLQMEALGDVAFARLFRPGHIRLEPLLPSPKELTDAVQATDQRRGVAEAKRIRQLLDEQGYRLLVAVGPRTCRSLQAARFRAAANVGPYRLFVPQGDQEFALAVLKAATRHTGRIES